MSLKGDKYETAEEVKFRLENTVVLYDKEPVYITRVQVPEAEDGKEVARVFFRKLPLDRNAAETRKFLSSRKFDLTPFPMGYFNSNGQALYANRVPVRQNKQGLAANTLAIDDIKGARFGGLNLNQLVSNKGFVDMIQGVYPTFGEVCNMIGKEESSSAALSRSFALRIDHDLEALYLIHKGIKCGIAMKGERGIKLANKFHFLRQELETHKIPLI